MSCYLTRGLVVFAVTLMLSTACMTRQRRPIYQALDAQSYRNTAAAQSSNADGLRFIREKDLPSAEKAFREALWNDLYYPPAHNNLGLVLLQTGRHYEAACEFEFAAKLAPRAVEPRNNLGVLYEEAGLLDKAAGEYEAVLKVDPNHLDSMQHFARTQAKAGRDDRTLKELLERIIMVSDDEHWNHWARGWLIRLGRNDEE